MKRKTNFFEGQSWFKFNILGLVLGTNLKFYTSLSKALKLKARKYRGLIRTFAEFTGEKLVGGPFYPSPPPILNRVEENHRLIAVDLSKQTKLKDPQQNNFIGKLENQAHGAKMFFFSVKSEDTTF